MKKPALLLSLVQAVALATTLALAVPAMAKDEKGAKAAEKAMPAGELIDVNSASRKELMTLPGIGEARADAIIKNRPYRGKDDLPAKDIIPQDVYDKVKDRIIARQKK
jgi:DNA uptake protein ComE-like DNA-binding protein